MTPPRGRFHAQPFDEGTLTKLDIFAGYTRAWLPVFLAGPSSPWQSIHIFDFFAGPGSDANGVPGSPIRLIDEIIATRHLAGWSSRAVFLHLFDSDEAKIASLQETIARRRDLPEHLNVDIQRLPFREALQSYADVLSNPRAAKLLFIDQFGVDEVLGDEFLSLVDYSTTDFLFFISSSILNRFAEHIAIKQKIIRPRDPYHVHRSVIAYYRALLPDPGQFYLAGFSIKKGPNIYGLIFGSKHPLGMDKFLQVAWKKDALNGEADFDINRDDIRPDQPRLPGFDPRPTKVAAFEADIEAKIRAGDVRSELDLVRVCFDHGMTRTHAGTVLSRLKKEGVIAAQFRVPDIKRRGSPRPVTLLIPPSHS